MKAMLTMLLCSFALPALADAPPKPAAAPYCASAPQLTSERGSKVWAFEAREVKVDANCLAKNGKPARGVLWLDTPLFSDGTIQPDIKGKNEQGVSFVGLAFHALDEVRYDAVYFRPFNFKNPERQKRSIQYISLPAYEWFTLREKWPGTYEHAPSPVPEPDDWFHVRIDVKHPQVTVFVNGSAQPSLTVTQLSSNKSGKIGLWTGGKNDGHFRSLTVRPLEK